MPAFTCRIIVLPEMKMFYTSFKESGSQLLETLADGMEFVPTTVQGLRQALTQK